MSEHILHAAQTFSTYSGRLKIYVTSSEGLIPIQNARITISYKGQPESTVETLTTDSSGQTETVELPAPPPEFSQEPAEQQPYSEYNIEVQAPGYESVLVSGTEILPDTTAIQPVRMIPAEEAEAPEETIVIPDHTLFGDYPPKIPEEEIKPLDETGEIVLSRVVIPEYVVVCGRLTLPPG